MKRYGFHDETCHIAETITRALEYLAMDQTPEFYAGTQRDESNFPMQYIGANVPQGWAAGSIFSLLQAMLGLNRMRRTGSCFWTRRFPTGCRASRFGT